MGGEDDSSDDSAAIRLENAEDVTVRNVEAKGFDAVVAADDVDNLTIEGEIAGSEKGVILEDTTATIYDAEFSGTPFGLVARPGADVTVVDTEFSGAAVTDILYHESSTVRLFNAVVGEITEMSDGALHRLDVPSLAANPHPIMHDPELYRISRAILKVEETTEELEQELAEILREKWAIIIDQAETASDIATVLDTLRWIIYLFLALQV